MIREAGPADIDHLVALGAEAHAVLPWPEGITFDAASFRDTVERVIEGGAVFLSGKGAIGLLAVPSIYNAAVEQALEVFFWAPDGQGDGLRRAAETWAAGRLLIMSAHEPDAERASNWYRRKGYTPIGRQFVKVV